jgi:acyl carrier protein
MMFVLLIASSAVVVLAVGFWEKHRVRQHLAGREPLTHDEFGRRFFPPERSAMAARVRRILSDHVPVDLSRLHPDDKLLEEIRMEGIDSLSTVEFILDVEREYGISIPDSASQQMITLRDLVNYIWEQRRGGTHREGTTEGREP